MTKDDYMKLSKERIAELLAERDAIPLVSLHTWQNPCANPNYPCSNPYHDCINCPRVYSGGHYTTTTDINFKKGK